MRSFFLLLVAGLCLEAGAQTEENPFGEAVNYDTATVNDSMYVAATEAVTENKPEGFKKYERFMPPIDTITELVTYVGIVPFKPLENDVYDGGTIDSLYWRAKKYLMEKYIKDYRANSKKEFVFPKDMLVEDVKPDGENGRIIIRPTIPLLVKNNNYSYTQTGTLTFKVEIRVKEDKYKYKFTNFVHNTTEKGTEKPIKTYVEYYTKIAKGYKGTDMILIAIDRMVKDVVKDLYKVMKDPVVVDPDDF